MHVNDIKISLNKKRRAIQEKYIMRKKIGQQS